jgi:transposase-like protein
MLEQEEVDEMAGLPKRYSAKLKFQVVLEALSGRKTPGQIAKMYGVHPNSVGLWKKVLLEHGSEVFERESRSDTREKRIADLEQLLGKKEVEIALLKNFLGRSG